jgi:hypothetical protein
MTLSGEWLLENKMCFKAVFNFYLSVGKMWSRHEEPGKWSSFDRRMLKARNSLKKTRAPGDKRWRDGSQQV